MARFHLPFASLEETELRMISMYLMAQCLRQSKGLEADWSLAGLGTIFDAVGTVNIGFAERIRGTSDKDAGVNAIVLLHCFSMAVTFAAQSLLSRYERPCLPGTPARKTAVQRQCLLEVATQPSAVSQQPTP